MGMMPCMGGMGGGMPGNTMPGGGMGGMPGAVVGMIYLGKRKRCIYIILNLPPTPPTNRVNPRYDICIQIQIYVKLRFLRSSIGLV